MPIGAILGLATAVGGVAQASAASKAAKAGERAANKADETERYIFDRNVELTEPQRLIGNNALAALAFENGIGPRPTASPGLEIREIAGDSLSDREPIYVEGGKGEGNVLGYRDVEVTNPSRFLVGDQSFDTREEAQAFVDQRAQTSFDYDPIDTPDPNLDFSLDAFEASPGYEFRIQEGNNALERMAAARGMRFSGASLKDAMRFAQGTASDEYGAFVGRKTNDFNHKYGVAQDKKNALRSLAGAGQVAMQAQIGAGDSFASGVSQNAFARGNAQAQGAIGVGNAITGGVNSLANVYGMAQSGYLGQKPGFGIKPLANPYGT